MYSLRVAAGEDASCLESLSADSSRACWACRDAFIERGGFEWSAAAKSSKDMNRSNLGNRCSSTDLVATTTAEPIVPVVLDASTAIYSLHLKGVGSRFTIRDAADRPVTLEVVGLLENSVLQGNLLVSEANFLKMFPDTAAIGSF